MKKIFFLIIIYCSSLIVVHAQFKDLLDFNNANGRNPNGDLAISGGQMFGMTEAGATFAGNIFSIDTNGTNFKNLLEFTGANGGNAFGSPTLVGNKLFGMTQQGGAYNDGVVFSIDTSGANYKIILTFNGTNGGYPFFTKPTISGKKLFGMTQLGGAVHDSGVVFTVDTNGANAKTLHNFSGTDGSRPVGSLTLSGGQLFGMTEYDGADTAGVIFSLDTNGNNYKILHNFDLRDGTPYGSLTLIGSALYGASWGDTGVIFRIDSNGSNYKSLFYFNGTNGKGPFDALILSGKTFYGLANQGGANNDGDIFSIDTNGSNFIDLFDFNGMNGCGPYGNVTIAGNSLYGMTITGGSSPCASPGNIFKYVIPALGISEIKTESKTINIFPNPFHSFTNVLFSQTGKYYLEIDDITGRKLEQFEFTGNEYKLSANNLSAGIYFLKIYNENEHYINTLKFIIQ